MPTVWRKKSIAARLKQLENKLHGLRRRHAFGEGSMDVYQEFSVELTAQKEAILLEIEQLGENLSNPKNLIKFACDLSTNLSKTWELGDIYQKIEFQNMLFPKGFVNDSQINEYRTPVVNLVISYVADLSKDLEHKKAGILEKLTKIPASYPEPESNRHGFPQVFETSASTNSAIRAIISRMKTRPQDRNLFNFNTSDFHFLHANIP